MSKPKVSSGLYILSLIFLFVLGFYLGHKYCNDKLYKAVAQAKIAYEDNKIIDEETLRAINDRDERLSKSLSDIGLSEEQVISLMDGEPSAYKKLKASLSKLFYKETVKYRVISDVKDCKDAVLGDNAANQVNAQIEAGRVKRRSEK